MPLGRAFIEVHADLKPFKKAIGKDVAAIVKETQKAVAKAVQDAAGEASGGGGKNRRSKDTSISIKPKIDTSDADRDSDRFFKRVTAQGSKAFYKVLDGFAFAVERSDTVKTAFMYVLAGAAITASPMVAAAIAGAISAGIGMAGIGAGVALAFQDARVKSAADAMWKSVMSGLDRVGGMFVQPTLKALNILAVAAQDFTGHLERGLRSVAPYVDNLAYGIAGFVDAIGPGLEAAFANSGPFIQIVAEYLPVVGDALGYLFEQLSASEGARAGLVAFFQVAVDLIVLTADSLTRLSAIFDGFIRWIDMLPDSVVPDGIQRDVDEMIAAMEMGKEPMAGFAGGLKKINTEASGAKDAATDLTASLNTFFGASLSSSDAAIAFEASLDNVAKSLKENNNSLNINTAKGRENVTMVNNSIKSAIASRDAIIKQTGSVAEGNAAYATQIERLRGVLHSAGLTKGQIDKLIGSYDDIPSAVATDVSAPGLSAALAQAARLNAELDRLNRKARTNPMGKGGNYTGVGGYAEGGVIRREQLAWVGEGNKPEAVVPLTNPKRAAEVMEEAGLGGFGGGTIVVQMVLDGQVIDERVVKVNQGQARQLQQQPRRII